MIFANYFLVKIAVALSFAASGALVISYHYYANIILLCVINPYFELPYIIFPSGAKNASVLFAVHQ